MAPKESEQSRSQSVSCAHEQTRTSESHPFAGLKTPWTEFHRFQTERLSRIAARIGVAPDQIADVVQEGWLDAWKHHEGFLGEDVEKRLSAWFSTVVVSKSRDALRRARRRRTESLDELPMEPVDREGESPAERIEAIERNESLATALEEMRKKDPLNHQLVCEHILESRSLLDLAFATGLGIHAMSCRIDRILKKLGVKLQE